MQNGFNEIKNNQSFENNFNYNNINFLTNMNNNNNINNNNFINQNQNQNNQNQIIIDKEANLINNNNLIKLDICDNKNINSEKNNKKIFINASSFKAPLNDDDLNMENPYKDF